MVLIPGGDFTMGKYGEADHSPAENPTGSEKGTFRVIRGGGWHSGPSCNRVHFRNALPGRWRDYNVGFVAFGTQQDHNLHGRRTRCRAGGAPGHPGRFTCHFEFRIRRVTQVAACALLCPAAGLSPFGWRASLRADFQPPRPSRP